MHGSSSASCPFVMDVSKFRFLITCNFLISKVDVKEYVDKNTHIHTPLYFTSYVYSILKPTDAH